MPEPEATYKAAYKVGPQTKPTALYFGTWGRAGHYLFVPGMVEPPWQERKALVTPWGVDGQLDRAPKWDVRDGRRYSGRHGAQGDAVLRHKDGWTWLAVADYTVDSRGNSHASFVFSEHLTFDEAVAAAARHFPKVAARVGEIREVPGGE